MYQTYAYRTCGTSYKIFGYKYVHNGCFIICHRWLIKLRYNSGSASWYNLYTIMRYKHTYFMLKYTFKKNSARCGSLRRGNTLKSNWIWTPNTHHTHPMIDLKAHIITITGHIHAYIYTITNNLNKIAGVVFSVSR